MCAGLYGHPVFWASYSENSFGPVKYLASLPMGELLKKLILTPQYIIQPASL